MGVEDIKLSGVLNEERACGTSRSEVIKKWNFQGQ